MSLVSDDIKDKKEEVNTIDEDIYTSEWDELVWKLAESRSKINNILK